MFTIQNSIAMVNRKFV